MSGYRCVSDCRSRDREFNPGPVPYFRGDWSWNNFYPHSPPFRWFIQEGLLSVTSESMCTNYWLTACSSLPRKSVFRWTDRLAMTIAVYLGRKATKQTNKQICSGKCNVVHFQWCHSCKVVCQWYFSRTILDSEKSSLFKKSKWVWSGNTTITNRRQRPGTERKSRSTIKVRCVVFEYFFFHNSNSLAHSCFLSLRNIWMNLLYYLFLASYSQLLWQGVNIDSFLLVWFRYSSSYVDYIAG